MARLKAAEIWAVAKSEPIFRWTALIVGVIGLIWLGVHVPPQVRGYVRSIDLRPVPSKTAVYRLENGRCISFASLPAGWTVDKGAIAGRTAGVEPGVYVWKDIEGVPFLQTMVFEDGGRRSMDLVSDIRVPEMDVSPYKAWRGVDSALVYLNGEMENYTRYLWCSTPDYGPRKRRVPNCDLHEDHTDPPGLSMSVSIPMHLMPKADAMIAEFKAVLQKLETSCEGAIAPPS